MSNGFDSDQDGLSVGPDLGPNCSQMFSADNKWVLSKKRVISIFYCCPIRTTSKVPINSYLNVLVKF